MKRVTVAQLWEVPPGGRKVVDAGGKTLVLFNVEGQLHAIANECPHSYAPLSDGELCGTIVTCPLHGWRFDVASGACASVPGVRVDTYPVHVEGEEVQVELDG